MTDSELHFGPGTSFDPHEQATLLGLERAILESDHPGKSSLHEMLTTQVERVGQLGLALTGYPPVFREKELGSRRRDLRTLVELLVKANDANIDLYLPTRALVGRALVLAELNAWRMMGYLCDELGAAGKELKGQVDHWLHGLVYTKCAEEVLQSISMDREMNLRIRERAVEYLCRLWETRHTYGVRHFVPLLAATWQARRRIRVSVGTLLGVSEIFRLLQVGCDPEFVTYFSRPLLTTDEQEAFQEFLIGVSTEQIHSLEQLMQERGRKALSPEEAAAVLGGLRQEDSSADRMGVKSYEFYRQRYLQAAARRLKNLPGPKKTAEEYVMIYFLDHHEPPVEE